MEGFYHSHVNYQAPSDMVNYHQNYYDDDLIL